MPEVAPLAIETHLDPIATSFSYDSRGELKHVTYSAGGEDFIDNTEVPGAPETVVTKVKRRVAAAPSELFSLCRWAAK